MSRVWAVVCAGLGMASAAFGEAVSEEASPAEVSAAAPAAEGEPAKRFGVSVDRKEPLEIRSDEFEAVREEGAKRFSFRKNVEVTQADVVIRAERLDAYYEPEARDPDRLEAAGGVVVTQGDREVRCERATYHRETEMLVCTGNAELRDGADRVRGEVIEFDLARETVMVSGDARLELHPRKDRPEAEPPG